ncbi:Retrotransposon protein [Abeliophyllum distichum]|uniref:Retrotransposon protein n=1 Tax=Abeliophyllum distichum TaxID=126358 RepID=A0ABD1PDK9_9LAMI
MDEPAIDEAHIGSGEPSVSKDTSALRKLSRVICPPRRFDLLITNGGLLIEEDESITYIESKSNVDSKRWQEAMESEMNSIQPDVSYTLSVTSRLQANPGEKYWIAVKNILKYLRMTKDMFLVSGGNELRVQGYADA